MVLAAGLQILANGEEIDIGGAEVVHHLQNLVALLAQPEHEARFGEQSRIDLLHLLQEADRRVVTRTGPYCQIVRGNRFQVVIEHVGLCRDDCLCRTVLAKKIGREHFDGRFGAPRADRVDNGCEMSCAAVIEIVPID